MKYMMFVATDPEPGNADDAMDIDDWISDVRRRQAADRGPAAADQRCHHDPGPVRSRRW